MQVSCLKLKYPETVFNETIFKKFYKEKIKTF